MFKLLLILILLSVTAAKESCQDSLCYTPTSIQEFMKKHNIHELSPNGDITGITGYIDQIEADNINKDMVGYNVDTYNRPYLAFKGNFYFDDNGNVKFIEAYNDTKVSTVFKRYTDLNDRTWVFSNMWNMSRYYSNSTYNDDIFNRMIKAFLLYKSKKNVSN